MERFKKLLPIFGIGLVDLIILGTNFIHGTFLMGWDNLMPEFDLPLNLERAIFAVWQGYRGLGNLDGLGNAATLTHTLIIWVLSLIFSLNSLRYIFIIGTHFVGGVGFYLLAKKLTHNKIASFAGALFYMLNLGVIQMYYAPLEAFAVHFAALPFVALFTINALKSRTPKNLLALFLVGFIFSSQGFIPTIFAVTLIFLLTIHASFVFKTRNFKYSFLVFLVFLLGNAFWLLPYSYSAIRTPAVISNTRINQFATEEVFFRNKAHGNLFDVLRFKGFMINSVELNSRAGTSGFLMEGWKNFSQTPIYNLLYLVFFILLVFGLIQVIRRKNYELFPFVISFFIAFFFLANDTFILSNLNDLVRLLPFVGEAFRFPFTKFITLFAFSFSIILTYALATISINKEQYKKAFYVFIVVLILFLANPALRGDFFSPLLRIPLPKDYLNLFKTMQSLDPNQRLVLFPVNSFWDWEYLQWGDIGSGFQWFGIPQAVTKRAFDPWSFQNEQFYNEISYEVSNQDSLGFMNVLKKYDVKYIMLDQNMMNSLVFQPINFDSLKKFMSKQSYITTKNTFGKLILYEINLPQSQVSQVSSSSTLNVDPNFNFELKDETYDIAGTYAQSFQNSDIIPLFPSLFSEKLQSNLEYSVSGNDREIILTSKKTFPKTSDNYTLEVPSFPQEEYLVPVTIEIKDGNLEFSPIYPQVYVNDQKFTLSDLPIKVPLQTIKNPTSITFLDTKNKVDLTRENPKTYLLTSFPNSLVVSDGKNQENLTFDTTFTNRSTFYVPIKHEQIKSVKVVIQKFPSALSYPNALKNGYKISNPDAQYNNNNSIIKTTKDSSGVDLFAKGASNELAFYLNNLPHSASYFVNVNSHYISGLPMDFYTNNPFENKSEVETKLSKTSDENYIIIPQSENYYSGYGFHFTVKSLGDEKAEAILKNVEVFPFPSNLVRGLRLVKSADEPIISKFNDKNPLSFIRLNLSEYLVDSNMEPGSYLMLSQSFDQGWAAYEIPKNNTLAQTLPFILGKKIGNHTLMNNWENGWLIENPNNNSSIVITYLPQYFEDLGFFLTIVTFLILAIEFWVDSRA